MRQVAIIAIGLGFPGMTVIAGAPSTLVAQPSNCALADWWNGKYMTGNWFGLRDRLGDAGLTFNGKYYGA